MKIAFTIVAAHYSEEPMTFAEMRQQAEHNRQEIIRALILDGLTREEAEAKERRNFARALRTHMS